VAGGLPTGGGGAAAGGRGGERPLRRFSGSKAANVPEQRGPFSGAVVTDSARPNRIAPEIPVEQGYVTHSVGFAWVSWPGSLAITVPYHDLWYYALIAGKLRRRHGFSAACPILNPPSRRRPTHQPGARTTAALSIFLPGFSQPFCVSVTGPRRTFRPEAARDNSVACHLEPEWILFSLNMLAGPDCSAECAIGPEKHGLGPENRKFASSQVRSGNKRGVALVGGRGKAGHFPAQSRPQWRAAGLRWVGNSGRTGRATACDANCRGTPLHRNRH
jgi:hypothetical protein